MTILSLSRLFLSFLLLSVTADAFTGSAEDNEIEVIPNPYDQSEATKTCSTNAQLEGLLEPAHLLTQPILTQGDTFVSIEFARVLTVPVPVYSMKQPWRISPAELEFQLVLVTKVSATADASLETVPVDPDAAADSWFPGYTWEPVIMTCGDESSPGYQHVGWKFTAMEGNTGAMPSFYALMVQFDKTHKVMPMAVGLGGFKAPGWMVTAIVS